MIKRIYVFANMGKLNQLPKSGGQSSARRVMKALDESDFEVVPIRRHRAELEGRWKHQIEILSFAVIDLLKIVRKMLFGRRHNSAFLHLTYAGPLVPYELLLTIVVRMMSYQSLIYLKGGQVIDFYPKGSKLHKWMFKKTMDLQTKVFFEGKESLELVKGLSKTPLVYFPNFVLDKQIPNMLPIKPKDRINILYFGRIAPNKNIDVIINTFELLCKRGICAYLTVIGGKGQSTSYVEMIDKRIVESPFAERITRMGIIPFEEIKHIMQTQHFFIFPSKEKAEGHSNSLNEAMSQGVIPIVSDYHFNQSIVQDNRLVVDGYNPVDYAERIRYIINHCNMDDLSKQVWQLVKDNYVYENIIGRISKEIRNI